MGCGILKIQNNNKIYSYMCLYVDIVDMHNTFFILNFSFALLEHREKFVIVPRQYENPFNQCDIDVRFLFFKYVTL